MTTTALTGLGLGAAFAGSLVLLICTWRGWRPVVRGAGPATDPRAAADTGRRRRRVGAAAATAVLVAVATRWPIAAAAAGVTVWMWPRMFGAASASAAQVARLEALATWTESLRDSVAGSIGLEEAIRHSLHAAPDVLVDPLQRLDGRLRAQLPLRQALAGFADEFDDSAADLVVAALIMNSTLRGPGLVATLTALARAAREEIDMRRKVEEGRKSLRRTALIIVVVTATFAGGLAVLSRDYVAPYSTPTGQVVLALVLGVFASGFMWIKNAADVRPPPRFLTTASGDPHPADPHPTDLRRAGHTPWAATSQDGIQRAAGGPGGPGGPGGRGDRGGDLSGDPRRRS